MTKPLTKTSNQSSTKAPTNIAVFRGIQTLLTLSGAAQKSARHVTEEDLGEISNAALVAINGKIAWVGSERQLPKKWAQDRSAAQIDLQTKLVLPGFVESHTHLLFGGSRAAEFERRIQGATYQEIAREGGGIQSTVRSTGETTSNELQKLGQERANLFLRQGVTTLEVKSGYGLSRKAEMRLLKIAKALKGPAIVTTYLGLHAVSPHHRHAKEYVQEVIDEDLPAIAKNGLASRVDVFVEDGYFTQEIAEPFLQKARELGFAITLHADQLSRCGGVALALRHKAVSADHLLRINGQDIRALAKSEVTCGLLPTADLYLRCPYPPARKLLDAGARVSLATDFNPGTSPTQDLNFVGLLARTQMSMSLPEVIVAYTLGAAYALGRSSQIGSLQIGKQCDFIAMQQPWQELFYSVGSSTISRVWIDGKEQKV